MFMHSRIPEFCSAIQWATDLWEQGLSFHPDDEPAEVLTLEGKPMFSEIEAKEAAAIVESFTEADYGDYVGEILSLFRANEVFARERSGDTSDEENEAFAGREALRKPSGAELGACLRGLVEWVTATLPASALQDVPAMKTASAMVAKLGGVPS